MVKIHHGIAAVFAALALLLAGCGGTEPTGAEPGDGPMMESGADPTESESGPVEGEGAPEEEEESGEPTGSFTDKIVYPDGVEIEFTKIKADKLTADEAEYSEAKKGTDYVILTMRIRNGSKVKLDLFTSISVSYGPDGETGEQYFNSEISDTDLPTGALLPGKAKTGDALFLIPAKYQGDVTAEVTTSMEHAPAIFTGSLK